MAKLTIFQQDNYEQEGLFTDPRLNKAGMKRLLHQAKDLLVQGFLPVPVHIHVPKGKDRYSKAPPVIRNSGKRFSQDLLREQKLNGDNRGYLERIFNPQLYESLNGIGVALGCKTYENQEVGLYALDLDFKYLPQDARPQWLEKVEAAIGGIDLGQSDTLGDVFYSALAQTVNGGYAFYFSYEGDLKEDLGWKTHNPNLTWLGDEAIIELRTDRFQVMPPTLGYSWVGNRFVPPRLEQESIEEMIEALKALSEKKERSSRKPLKAVLSTQEATPLKLSYQPIKDYLEKHPDPRTALYSFGYADSGEWTVVRPGDATHEKSGEIIQDEEGKLKYVEYSTSGLVASVVGSGQPLNSAEVFGALHGLDCTSHLGQERLKLLLHSRGYGDGKVAKGPILVHKAHSLILGQFMAEMDISYCLWSERLLYRPKGGRGQLAVDDRFDGALDWHFRQVGFPIGQQTLRMYKERLSALAPQENVLAEKVKGFQSDPDLIHKVLAWLNIDTKYRPGNWSKKDYEEFLGVLLLKWMAGVMGQILLAHPYRREGLATELCPYFFGDQAAYKTRFLKWLLEPLEGYIRWDVPGEEYQEKLAMTQKAVIVDEEASWMTKKGTQHIKGMLSSTTVSYRKKYSPNTTEAPRRASLIATGNLSNTINDFENRRIIPIPIRESDIESIEQEDVTLLWGYARDLFQADESVIYLDRNSLEGLKTYSRAFRVENVARQWLEENVLLHPAKGTITMQMAVTDLRKIAKLCLDKENDISLRVHNFNAELRALGFDVKTARFGDGVYAKAITFHCHWTVAQDTAISENLIVPALADPIPMSRLKARVEEEEDQEEDQDVPGLPF